MRQSILVQMAALAASIIVLQSCGSGAVLSGTSAYSTESSILPISEKELTDMDRDVYNDIYDYLRGRVAGVDVSESSSGNPKIIIRGKKSIWGEDPDPLFIYDGRIIYDISVLRPEDIYSVQVLKDAAASAYGSRSSNGVIVFKSIFAHDSELREAALRAEKKASRKRQ